MGPARQAFSQWRPSQAHQGRLQLHNAVQAGASRWSRPHRFARSLEELISPRSGGFKKPGFFLSRNSARPHRCARSAEKLISHDEVVSEKPIFFRSENSLFE